MVVSIDDSAAKAVPGYIKSIALEDASGTVVIDFTGANPFGNSSTNLGSLYKGMVKDTSQNFKHLRKTKHTHNPLDDARGNAEALLAMKAMGLKISL